MSKIQINELNAASIEVLNAQETAEVNGGNSLFGFGNSLTSINFQDFRKQASAFQFADVDSTNVSFGGSINSTTFANQVSNINQ